MNRSRDSLPRLWKALNVIQDYVSSGFSRNRPALAIAEAADTPPGQGASRAAPRRIPAQDDLSFIASEIAACVSCGLCNGRGTTVPGEGAAQPPVMFVGEGPGEEEDRTGRPFVGAAGKYLDKWIAAIGLRREECFIANVVKCRPPRNREPHPEEIAACLPYLERQLGAVKPRAICCLGRIAAHTLLQTTAGIATLRGKVHRWRDIPVVVTYHPSAVLRESSLRKPVWEDLKVLKTLIVDRPGEPETSS